MSKTMFKNITIDEKDVDSKERTITAIGSKEVIDRDGDVIVVKGINLKEYKKNPVVLFAHDHRGIPVGKTKRVWVDGNELKFKIEFATADENPMAESLFRLYKKGFMSSFSIGFIPDFQTMEYPEQKSRGKKKQPRCIINNSELLEISCVSVPANPSALMASFEKGWEDGSLDGMELLALQDECKEFEKLFEEEKEAEMAAQEYHIEDKERHTILSQEDHISDEEVTNIPKEKNQAPPEEWAQKQEDKDKEIEALKQKIKDLEFTKEVEVDMDSYLTKLFEEFEASGANELLDDDCIENEEDFDEYVNKILGDE